MRRTLVQLIVLAAASRTQAQQGARAPPTRRERAPACPGLTACMQCIAQHHLRGMACNATARWHPAGHTPHLAPGPHVIVNGGISKASVAAVGAGITVDLVVW